MKKENTQAKLTYEETRFFGLIKIVGVKEFFGFALLWSSVITLALIGISMRFAPKNIDYALIGKELVSYLIGASASIFGIVIAALSVTLVLFHESLLPVLLKHKLLHKFLFPFWYAVAMWSINIVSLLFTYLIQALYLNKLMQWLVYLDIFLFLYATFYTVGLTGLVIRLALQKAQK